MSKQGVSIFLIALISILLIICLCCGSLLLIASAASTPTSVEDRINEKVLEESTSSNKIAVIEIEGMIAGSQDPLNRNYNMVDDIMVKLDKAHEDDSVKAVIIRLDTPGGTVYDSDLIAQKVIEVKKDKPVIALMSSSATSGGYYIAAPSNKIVASDASITGSIGVIVQTLDIDGLYEKVGIKPITITSTKSDVKAFDNLEDPNSKSRKVLQKVLDDHYENFVTVVANGRGMERAEVEKLADGSIYSGTEAKRLGLVDEIGGMDKAIELAESEAQIDDSQVVIYESYMNPFDAFSIGLVSQINPVANLTDKVNTEPGIYSYYLAE